MSSTQQPKALQLAEHLEKFRSFPEDIAAAAELRSQHARIAELEAQLEESTHITQNGMGGNWLTVVYRDIQPGDEAHAIAGHPKASALSWSHALHERDTAIAAQAKQGGAQ